MRLNILVPKKCYSYIGFSHWKSMSIWVHETAKRLWYFTRAFFDQRGIIPANYSQTLLLFCRAFTSINLFKHIILPSPLVMSSPFFITDICNNNKALGSHTQICLFWHSVTDGRYKVIHQVCVYRNSIPLHWRRRWRQLLRMTKKFPEQDRQKLTSVHLWFVDTPYVLSFVGTCVNTNQAASA